jgi:hypothetical protein
MALTAFELTLPAVPVARALQRKARQCSNSSLSPGAAPPFIGNVTTGLLGRET